MGKQKRQRSRPHKQNPTGLVSVKDFEIEEIKNVTNENREHALQRVYEEVSFCYIKCYSIHCRIHKINCKFINVTGTVCECRGKVVWIAND